MQVSLSSHLSKGPKINNSVALFVPSPQVQPPHEAKEQETLCTEDEYTDKQSLANSEGAAIAHR